MDSRWAVAIRDPGDAELGPGSHFCRRERRVSSFGLGIMTATTLRFGESKVSASHHLLAGLAAWATVAVISPAVAVTIEFNYDFDNDGFFFEERRDLLQVAGDYVGNRLTDSLTAIESGGGNTFKPNFSDPIATNGSRQLDARSIPEETLIIY